MGELLSDGRVVAGLFSAGAVLFVAICGGLIALGRWMGSTGKEVTHLEETAARDRSAFNKEVAHLEETAARDRSALNKEVTHLEETAARDRSALNKEVTHLEETAARDRSAFNKVAEEIRRDIDVIREDIKRILHLIPSTPALFQSDSPLRLTEFGEKVSASLGAASWAGKVAVELKHELADKQPYQIDAMSRKYVQDDLSDEMKERVAIAVYEFGIDEDGVRKVLAVVLREKLLET